MITFYRGNAQFLIIMPTKIDWKNEARHDIIKKIISMNGGFP